MNNLYRKGVKIEGGLRTREKVEGNHPLITVVTVVKNGASYLEKAIRSVLAQTWPNIEYIIIDGGSTDGTLDIIHRYEDQLDYWISESDSGIYDAMNKAIDNAKGDWIYFLGADDQLARPETFINIVPHLDERVALVIGGIRYPNGRVVRSSIGPRILIRNTLHHQGALYNARLFKSWRYDSTLRIVADYELNLLVYLARQPYVKVKEVIAVCGNRGVSLTQWDTAVAETNALRKRHVGPLANRIFSGFFLLEFKVYRLIASMRKKSTA